MIAVALDTNLLLLLIVGRVSPRLVGRHKRLQAYLPRDFELLVKAIRQADKLIATPNALSEVSNLAGYGVHEPLRTAVYESLRQVIDDVTETYRNSRVVAHERDFIKLGLTDCAWLVSLDNDTDLMTDDQNLYQAALHRGLNVTNFTHLRKERGFL
jgi:hypothetical protein